MHHEVLKPKVISGTTHYFLLAVIALLALFVAPLAHNFILPNMNYGIYLAIVIAAAIVVRRQMTEYRYSLIADELIIDRIWGKHVRKLITINLRNVQSFGPYKRAVNNKGKTLYYSMKIAKGAYALVVSTNGVDERIVFHPSEKMVRCIERQINREKGDKSDCCQ